MRQSSCTTIHAFSQVLGGNIADQLTFGGYRWFEVVLYWVFLIGSLSIASTNWRLDPVPTPCGWSAPASEELSSITGNVVDA